VPALSGPADPSVYFPLIQHLAMFYEPDHPATLIVTPGGGTPGGRQTAELARFPELVPLITTTAHLFLDAARRQTPATAPQ
jgi:hypothetical protein